MAFDIRAGKRAFRDKRAKGFSEFINDPDGARINNGYLKNNIVDSVVDDGSIVGTVGDVADTALLGEAGLRFLNNNLARLSPNAALKVLPRIASKFVPGLNAVALGADLYQVYNYAKTHPFNIRDFNNIDMSDVYGEE